MAKSKSWGNRESLFRTEDFSERPALFWGLWKSVTELSAGEQETEAKTKREGTGFEKERELAGSPDYRFTGISNVRMDGWMNGWMERQDKNNRDSLSTKVFLFKIKNWPSICVVPVELMTSGTGRRSSTDVSKSRLKSPQQSAPQPW